MNFRVKSFTRSLPAEIANRTLIHANTLINSENLSVEDKLKIFDLLAKEVSRTNKQANDKYNIETYGVRLSPRAVQAKLNQYKYLIAEGQTERLLNSLEWVFKGSRFDIEITLDNIDGIMNILKSIADGGER